MRRLIRAFRSELNALNQIDEPPTDHAVKDDAENFFVGQRTVFGASDYASLLGFVVLKEEAGVFWLDWMHVAASARRRGVGSMLFNHAERHARKHGADKLFIYVHPDNTGMLALLAKQGYDALNLIEVTRKTRTKGKTLDVFGHRLRY